MADFDNPVKMRPYGEQKLSVIHSLRVWLKQTNTWIYNQIRFLPNGCNNHIVCERTENLDQFWLPNIHSLIGNSRIKDFIIKKLMKQGIPVYSNYLLKNGRIHGFQILHSHFGPLGWANMGVSKQIGVKHIVTYYGWDVHRLPTIEPIWKERYKSLFKHIDLVLCEGPHMARCLVGLGCPEDKVKVQHLGVSMDEIPFTPRRWTPSAPLQVLIAASFREKKGIPYALEALAKLQHEVPLEITIIGDSDSEPRSEEEKCRILAIIERYNLQDKVRMLGYQTYNNFLREAYQHHIFLSPSVTASDGDTEGGAPVTIIEMAASGMLIVSTWHCDIPHVIRNGETGLLAEERDVEGLLHHLRWLVAHPEKWSAMQEAGRKHIESEYNAMVQGERLMAVYIQLLDNRI
jgi:colanic acid/amylovoran biosynthesis glycosyltransferase